MIRAAALCAALVAISPAHAAAQITGTPAATPAATPANAVTRPLRLRNLVGMTYADAAAYLARNKLAAQEVSRPSDRPIGEVIQQSPRAGANLRDIESVTLVVSAGPTNTPVNATMPNLIRDTIEQASNALGPRAPTVKYRQGPSSFPAGLIYQQYPAPGTDISSVKRIVLSVSTGPSAGPKITPTAAPAPLPLPNFVGKPYASAAAYLSRRGLTFRPRLRVSDARASGEVLRQSPAAGADERTIKKVTLVVSAPVIPPAPTVAPTTAPSPTAHPTNAKPSPHPKPSARPKPSAHPKPSAPATTAARVVVPNLVGFMQRDGATRIAQSTLRGALRGRELGPQAAGVITRTEPVAGTALQRGAIVGYWLAAGQNRVPDVRGLSAADSEALLKERGFLLGAVAYASGNGTGAQRQDPAAGTVAPVGSAVAITVARGSGARGFNNAWASIAALGGAALAALLGVTIGLRVRSVRLTRRLLSIRPSIDAATPVVFTQDPAPAGPRTALQARVEPGEPSFDGDVPVNDREVQDE